MASTMAADSDVTWIRLVRRATGTFVQHERLLSSIKNHLTSPGTQFPGLVLFLGEHRMNAGLRHLFTANTITSQRPNIRLQVDNSTWFSDYPVLFADCDPNVIPLKEEDDDFPFSEEFVVPWASDMACHTHDIILSRVFGLFADVICIFADDVGGVHAVQTVLATWAKFARKGSSLDHRPRVLVIVEDSASITQDILMEYDLDYHSLDISDVFCTPRIVRLARYDDADPGTAQNRILQDVINEGLEGSRNQRREDGCLFSAAHLDGLFHRVLQHVCRAPDVPFDFVREARGSMVDECDPLSHLVNFINLTCDWNAESRATVLASAFLVDAYRPGAHFFNPAAVFDSLYRALCGEALSVSAASTLRLQLVEYQLAGFYRQLLLGQGPPRRIHEANLARMTDIFSSVVSGQTCLACILRPPQHPLSCGHAYCDICAAGYGVPVEGGEYQYLVRDCIICQRRCGNIANVLPPTGCVRAIAVDGGGVRGFIPLRFLDCIQRQVGPECPLPHLFDVAFGTRSGGIVVLKIFHQYCSVGECAQAFSYMMTRFFQESSPLSYWEKFLRAIKCRWTDGWYSAKKWEELLQEQFDTEKRMFDVQPISGLKVAVVAAAGKRPMLLVNHRRTRAIADQGGFDTFGNRMPDNSLLSRDLSSASADESEPGAKTMAMCTSDYCCPCVRYPPPHRPDHELIYFSLFSPIQLEGIGNCEYGGSKFDNPSTLCRSETKFMWPARSEPVCFVSLGTGCPSKDVPRGGHARLNWTRVFASRLKDSFVESTDAEQAWEGLLDQTHPARKKDYHRLNVTFPGQESSSNVSAQVRRMVSLVDETAADQVPPALTSVLLASLFLELSSAPRWENGWYYCIGTIRCRIQGLIFVSTLKRLHPRASSYIQDGEVLNISPYDDAICLHCARYRVPVRLAVKSPETQISLSIQLDSLNARPIAGFPTSLRWLLERQGLDPFGCCTTSPQGLLARSECKSCDLKVYRKGSSIQKPTTYRKKVRFI
ncbi:uncharacterized protein LDX57_008663 [Aspergillus melleus]|uniref:uncharacterized protein n=1 Tax=Aspergillus melleus TaxID=138277 RepID=UPI001E8D2155|nr:uncharacterized protein LDX57_008663 [Aspergillus melleus]KAH8431002.1 hypothetical protein LDX57_008663 [Aspergillus melleus]